MKRKENFYKPINQQVYRFFQLSVFFIQLIFIEIELRWRWPGIVWLDLNTCKLSFEFEFLFFNWTFHYERAQYECTSRKSLNVTEAKINKHLISSTFVLRFKYSFNYCCHFWHQNRVNVDKRFYSRQQYELCFLSQWWK